MLARTVSCRIMVSWLTTAIRARSDARDSSGSGTPSSRTVPCLRIVEARHQFEQRGLPRSARARPAPPSRPCARVSETSCSTGVPRIVAEGDVVEREVALERRRRARRAGRPRSRGMSSSAKMRAALASACASCAGTWVIALSGDMTRSARMRNAIVDRRVHVRRRRPTGSTPPRGSASPSRRRTVRSPAR